MHFKCSFLPVKTGIPLYLLFKLYLNNAFQRLLPPFERQDFHLDLLFNLYLNKAFQRLLPPFGTTGFLEICDSNSIEIKHFKGSFLTLKDRISLRFAVQIPFKWSMSKAPSSLWKTGFPLDLLFKHYSNPFERHDFLYICYSNST